MRTIGKIKREVFEGYFGKLQTDEVIVTEERIEHIKTRHPEDYKLFEAYCGDCLISPDWIITDNRNAGTVYMIKKMDVVNLSMVIRLALATDENGLKNLVMTFWRIRDKNVEKLSRKNKVLYKNE